MLIIKKNSQEVFKILSDDLTTQTLVDILTVYLRTEIHTTVGQTRWFHKLMWFFHNISFSASFTVVIVYWALLSPTDENKTSPLNIHIHGITLVIMLIDAFVVKHPIQLLHFLVTSIVGLTYIVYTLILHLTGVESEVYPFLDWQNSAGTAAGMGIGFGLAGGIIGQLVHFSLYQIKLAIHKSCCRSDREGSNITTDGEVDVKTTYSNEAFRF